MAFPSVAATSTGRTTAVNTTSHSITMPSGITAGDLLIIVFSCDGASSLTAPSDWTYYADATYSTVVKQFILWKIAEGSDTCSLTTSGSEQSSHIVYRIQNGYFKGATLTTGNSTNPDPPSITIIDGAEDYLWLVAHTSDSTVVSTAAPTDYSNLLTQAAAGTAGASTSTAYRTANASTENPGTFTANTEQWAAATICVGYVDSANIVSVNTDAYVAVISLTASTGGGFSFTGDGGSINSLIIPIELGATGTGYLEARIYAHSGTYGTSSIGTGSALATSSSIAVANLASYPAQTHKLVFSTPYATTNGTNYVIMLWRDSGTGTARATRENTRGLSGNYVTYASSTWGYDASYDVVHILTKAASGGAQTLTLSLFTNSNTIYSPAVKYVIATPYYTNSNTFYAPTVTPQAVTLTLPYTTNTNTFYSHTLTPQAVTLTVPLITNSNTFYEHTVTPQAVTITAPLYTNTNTIYNHTIAPQAVTVTVPYLENTSTIYDHTIAFPTQTLTVPFLNDIGGTTVKSFYFDSKGRVYLVINQELGLVEKV